MRNLLTGFLFGVLATSGVFLLTKTPEDARSSGPDAPPAAPRSANAPTVSPESVGVPHDAPAVESGAERPSPVSAEVSAIDLPGAGSPAAASTGPAAEAAPRTMSLDAAPPRNYPPEIAEMIENRVDPALQHRYESDAREESWATYMEGQLQAYFASKPALQQFNFSLIDCRTSVCSVHALGYGPDALTQWNLATADIVTQPWHDFKSMSMDRQNPEPDVLGIVLILTRQPP